MSDSNVTVPPTTLAAAEENARLQAMLGERDAQIAMLEGQLRRCAVVEPEQQHSLETTACGVPLGVRVQEYLVAELRPPIPSAAAPTQQASVQCTSPRPQPTAEASPDITAPRVSVQQPTTAQQALILDDWDPIDDEDLDVTRQRGPAVPDNGASPIVDASLVEARSPGGNCCGGSRHHIDPPPPLQLQVPQTVAPSAPQQVAVCVETVAAPRNRSLSTPPAAHRHRSNSMQPLPPAPAVPGHTAAVSYAAPLGSSQASRVLSVPRQPLPSPLHPSQAHPPKQATAWLRVATPKQHRAWTPRRSPPPVHRNVTPTRMRTRPPSEGPPAPVSYSAWPLAMLGRQQPFWQSTHGGHAQAQSQTGPWSTTTLSSTTPRMPPVAGGLLVPPQAQPLPRGSGPGTAAGWQQQCSPPQVLPGRQQLAAPLPGPPAHHASHTSLLLQGPPLKPTVKPAEIPVFPAVQIHH